MRIKGYSLYKRGKLSTRKFSGFTLVELIIAITILGILGTIGFLSIQGYSSSARDSSRIESLSNLHKGLSLFQLKAGTYPLPESPVKITASGITLGHQGFAGNTIVNIVKLSDGATKDPLDTTMLTTYSVNANQTKMEIMSFLENGTSIVGYIPQGYASSSSDYSKRIPIQRGDILGVFLVNTGSQLNQPIQENGMDIDLTKTFMGSGYTLAFSNQDTTASVIVSGTGAYTGSLFTFLYNKRDDLLKNKTLASLDSSLVGYWDMGTVTASGLLQDWSSYSNDGVCYNGTLSGSCGITGPQIIDGSGRNEKVMQFDGTGDYVLLDTPLSVPYVTIAAWERDTSTGANFYEYIVSNNRDCCATENGYSLNISYAPTVPRFQIYTEEGVSSNMNGPIDIRDNSWHFMAATYDGVYQKLYIDNKLVKSKLLNLGPISMPAAYNMTIGGLASSPWAYSIHGMLSSTRIYNRALSESEILSLYNITK